MSAAFAGSAHAAALDEDFRSLCVAHKGASTPILAAADAAGWKVLPTNGAPPPQIPGGGTLKTFSMRLKSEGATPRLLVVGDGSVPGDDGQPEVAMKICFLASTQPDPDSLASEKASLKGEPTLQTPQATIYLVETASGAVSPLKGDAADAKFKKGELATVMLMDTPQATAFGYQLPQPNP
jgi:hypothetical protein